MSIYSGSLEKIEDLNRIDELSHQVEKGVGLFKDSLRCIVSKTVKRNLEGAWDLDPEELPVFYLDLLSYREISNAIAERYGVQHESPQFLLIKDGNCVWNGSHHEVDRSRILEALSHV